MGDYDDHDMEQAEKIGMQKGREELRIKINNWLQAKYDDPKIERGSIDGAAILDLVRQLNRALNEGTL